MNKMIRTLMTLAALAVGSTALQAQPALKLIVVDMAKVFDAHYKSEEANAKFRDAEQKAREQAEELNKQGQALVEEYKELQEQAKNALLTPEARTKAEGDAQKKLDEIVVAVAQLAKLSFAETERLLMGVWPSPVAVIFKAIGFKLSTLAAVYDARLPSGKAAGPDLVRTKAEFIALSRPTAERILRFYQVRKTAAAPATKPE